MCRFPFFLLRYEVSLGRKSLDPILRICAWSLNAPCLKISWVSKHWSGFTFGPLPQFDRTAQVAFIGKWPRCDSSGVPLQDKKSVQRAGTSMSDRWAVTEYRGDWSLCWINKVSFFSKFRKIITNMFCPKCWNLNHDQGNGMPTYG